MSAAASGRPQHVKARWSRRARCRRAERRLRPGARFLVVDVGVGLLTSLRLEPLAARACGAIEVHAKSTAPKKQ